MENDANVSSKPMIYINGMSFDEIMENHHHYLAKDCNNWNKMRAKFDHERISEVSLSNMVFGLASFKNAHFDKCTFENCDFRGADFSGATIITSTFKNCDFTGAIFSKARISSSCFDFSEFDNTDLTKIIGDRLSFKEATMLNCDLNRSHFVKSNFYKIGISTCSLFGSDISDCLFDYAVISHSIFMMTNGSYTSFANSKITDSYFHHSDLSSTDFSKANIDLDSRFDNTEFYSIDQNKLPFIPSICPPEGSFIGYKCGVDKFDSLKLYLITLEIPADAKRLSSSVGRQCRCNKAKVLSIVDFDGNSISKCRSFYDASFIYEVNSIVKEDNLDENRFNPFSTGIYFWMTKEEAIKYGKRYGAE